MAPAFSTVSNLIKIAVIVCRSVAVEYITSKGPASLDGQLFNFNSAPNRYGLGEFYELHVWPGRATRPALSPT